MRMKSGVPGGTLVLQEPKYIYSHKSMLDNDTIIGEASNQKRH